MPHPSGNGFQSSCWNARRCSKNTSAEPPSSKDERLNCRLRLYDIFCKTPTGRFVQPQQVRTKPDDPPAANLLGTAAEDKPDLSRKAGNYKPFCSPYTCLAIHYAYYNRNAGIIHLSKRAIIYATASVNIKYSVPP